MKGYLKRGMAAAAVCQMLLAACGGGQQAAPGRDYATCKVEPRSVTMSQDYSATIRGRQDVDIFPQVSGTITDVCVAEGEQVRRGQTLFVIDQVPFGAALKMAEADVAAAEAAVATARLASESKHKLFDRGVVSEFEMLTADNALASAQAHLAQMEAVRVNAANDYSYTTVKSPADGVVGSIPYRVGALVSPQNPRPLTTVSDNSQMYVYFSITENRLLDLVCDHGSMSEALGALPDVALVLNNGRLYDEPGRIESISGVINTSTGTASLRAVFPNPRRILHSGASGNVRMPETYPLCLTVPKRATYELQDRIYVYRVVGGKAVATMISVAENNPVDEYIVTSGLTAGDEIVAEGVALLRDGDRVRSQQEGR